MPFAGTQICLPSATGSARKPFSPGKHGASWAKKFARAHSNERARAPLAAIQAPSRIDRQRGAWMAFDCAMWCCRKLDSYLRNCRAAARLSCIFGRRGANFDHGAPTWPVAARLAAAPSGGRPAAAGRQRTMTAGRTEQIWKLVAASANNHRVSNFLFFLPPALHLIIIQLPLAPKQIRGRPVQLQDET